MSKEQTGLTPTSKNPEHETQSQFYRNNFIEQFYINLQFISNKLLGEKKNLCSFVSLASIIQSE